MEDDTVERLTQRLWAVRRARDGVLSAAPQPPCSEPDGESRTRDRSPDRADRSGDHGDRSGDRSADAAPGGDGPEQLQRRRIDDYTTSVRRLREQRDAAAAQQRRLCRSDGARRGRDTGWGGVSRPHRRNAS